MRPFETRTHTTAVTRLLVCSVFAAASMQAFGGDPVCPPALPNPLPMNQTVNAFSCNPAGSTPCNSATYESPISTSTLTLDSPSSVSFAAQAIGTQTFTPTLYVSGGICDVLQCDSSGPLPDLPAGSYCVTVTASAFDAVGSCGCFALLLNSGAPNLIFADGFDSAAGLE